MISMSEDFKKSISSTEREMKGYVEVLYKGLSSTNPRFPATIEVDNTPEILQINNQDIDVNALIDDDRKGKNYASLEQDYFQLDGTFVLPNNEADKNPGIGYVTEYTYEEQKEEITSVNPFHFTSSENVCNGITIYFQNNLPTDLRIRVGYYSLARDLGQEVFEDFTDINVTNNGVATLTFSERMVLDIYVYVNDVLYPNRRLRIQEVDLGITALYEGEELVSFKTIEQCDRFCDSIPINECIVEIGDYQDSFDPINPKGITKYLNNGVIIKPFAGVVTDNNGVEYCPMGVYYLESWDKSYGKATLNAKDIFSKLNGDDYSIKKYDTTRLNRLDYSSYLTEKSNQWGIDINNLVINNSDYIITKDTSENTITIPMNFVGTESKLLSLQKFCTAFGNTVTSNRNGGINYISSLKHVIQPFRIDKKLLKEYQTIENKNPYKTITVVEKQYCGTNNSGDNTQIVTLFTKTIECNGITEFKFEFDKVEWISPLSYSYSGTGTPILLSCNIDVNTNMQFAKQIYMKFNYVGSITITATGGKDIFALNNYEVKKEFNNDGEELQIDNDFLSYLTIFANTISEQAEAIINYRNKNQNNLITSFNFNGNPAIECGDCIEVESKYPDDNGDTKYDSVWITKIESEYKGSFSQSIEGDIV